MSTLSLKTRIINALESSKAQDIKAINISDVSDFADDMIVVSGTSSTHVKALSRNVSDALRKQGCKPIHSSGESEGEWVVVDFGEAVLHIMHPEVREHYALEKFWDEDMRLLLEKHRNNAD